MRKMAHVKEMHENHLQIFRITTFQSLCSPHKQDTVTFRWDGKIFFPPKATHIWNREITRRIFTYCVEQIGSSQQQQHFFGIQVRRQALVAADFTAAARSAGGRPEREISEHVSPPKALSLQLHSFAQLGPGCTWGLCLPAATLQLICQS